MPIKQILAAFPKLAFDTSFRVSSREDTSYNCIAWAGMRNDEFWWPIKKPYIYDGVKYNWPFSITYGFELKCFIELFSHLGYNLESSDFSNEHPEYRKIALYIKPDENLTDIYKCECTHAARQLKNGLWASKLGIKSDIEHANPCDLEGHYGKLAIILKKKLI